MIFTRSEWDLLCGYMHRGEISKNTWDRLCSVQFSDFSTEYEIEWARRVLKDPDGESVVEAVSEIHRLRSKRK